MLDKTENKPDESGKVQMEGHILIKDKNTGEVLVDKKNAIHFGNMAYTIASALSHHNLNDSGIYWMGFGNGGSDIFHILLLNVSFNLSESYVPSIKYFILI